MVEFECIFEFISFMFEFTVDVDMFEFIIGVDIFEFIIAMFVFKFLFTFVFAVSVQAMPNAPIAKTAESAKVFFIIIYSLLSSSKIKFILVGYFKSRVPNSFFRNIGQYRILACFSQIQN